MSKKRSATKRITTPKEAAKTGVVAEVAVAKKPVAAQKPVAPQTLMKNVVAVILAADGRNEVQDCPVAVRLPSHGISRIVMVADELREVASQLRYIWDSVHPEKILVLKSGWIMTDDLVEEMLGYTAPCLFLFKDGWHNAGLILSDAGTNVVRRFTDWASEQPVSFNDLILRGQNGYLFQKNLGFHYELHPDYYPSRFLDVDSASTAQLRALLGDGEVIAEEVITEDVIAKESCVNKVTAIEVDADIAEGEDIAITDYSYTSI